MAKATLVIDMPPAATNASSRVAALRALRFFLDKLDPERAWGSLRKVFTPEGHVLWLCNRHAQRYSVGAARSSTGDIATARAAVATQSCGPRIHD